MERVRSIGAGSSGAGWFDLGRVGEGGVEGGLDSFEKREPVPALNGRGSKIWTPGIDVNVNVTCRGLWDLFFFAGFIYSDYSC